MKRSLSSLILTPTFPYYPDQTGSNGGSQFIFQKVRHLQDIGVENTVITSDCPELTPEEINKINNAAPDSIKVERFSYFSPRRMQRLTYMAAGVPDQLFKKKDLLAWIQLPLFIFSFFIRALPHARKCDIIHAHWVLSAIPGLVLKWLYKKPLFLTVREGDTNLISSNLIMRFIVRNSDYLIANTDEYFRHMRICGAPSTKFFKIRNGVDPIFRRIDKEVVREKFGLSSDNISIITAAYLIPRKNPELLLKAFIRIEKKYPALLLFFAGEGPLLEKLHDIVNSNNLSNKVKFIGNLNHRNLNMWFNASDIFCLPTNSDGIANSVVEAMQCGLPVITTNVGGFPEIIGNGTSGFLMEPNDLESLVSLLVKLIENPNLRLEMGISSQRQLIRKGINWKINAKLHLAAYQKVLN